MINVRQILFIRHTLSFYCIQLYRKVENSKRHKASKQGIVDLTQLGAQLCYPLSKTWYFGNGASDTAETQKIRCPVSEALYMDANSLEHILFSFYPVVECEETLSVRYALRLCGDWTKTVGDTT